MKSNSDLPIEISQRLAIEEWEDELDEALPEDPAWRQGDNLLKICALVQHARRTGFEMPRGGVGQYVDIFEEA